MEAGNEPRNRTQVNLSAGFLGLGERARQRDARFPIAVGGVLSAGAAGHCSTLLQEISIGPACDGRAREGNDERPMSMETSDHPMVAWMPGNASGAKGDKLKRAESRQLTLMFADSPVGGKGGRNADESAGRAYLLLQANAKEATDSAAWTAGTARLLEQVASIPNLARALLNAARNKGSSGVDSRCVDEVMDSDPKLLPKLNRELLSGSYQPGDIRRVWIPKPGGGQRGLGIPNVVDRIVQQAALQMLGPIFEPTFHDSSHGFRPGRGASTAIAEAKGVFGSRICSHGRY